ncbi:uncharacterized protein LOC129758539 [Uranotaenia lowii]|uniref:uncharacterized protein LOC129742610 n=1 Tax=Uranotaenia lowii TaxID=190385 RepID=UPI00247877E8|nr:uncharacterized protein LOC129742610 [Uranotaenia lowii]XP_055612038.1 uncharacterized protein LOC129758539 [Uranotaenia lowii]
MPGSRTTKKEDPSLRHLTVKCSNIQASLQDIFRFVEDFTDDTMTEMIEVRLTRLDELWEGFENVMIDIQSHEEHVEEDNPNIERKRREFSNLYYQAKAFMLSKVKDRTVPNSSGQLPRGLDSTIQETHDHIRLPQIKLPSFSGDIDEWLGFRDLFISLIHVKPELPDIEKFYYLKGCLQGEARALLDPIQVSQANYQVAWDTLVNRYSNSKLLKRRQISSLFGLPTMHKESVTELQSLLDGFERIVHTLDQVVHVNDYKDLLLVNFLTARLDHVTRRSWEEHSSTEEQDTIEDLISFLHRRIRILESLPPKVIESKGVNQNSTNRSRPTLLRTSYATAQSIGIQCALCKEDHLLHQCSDFRHLPVNERDAFLKSHSLCRNCFRIGHHAKECQSRFSCRICKGRHHTLVCFKTNRQDGVLEDSQVRISNTSSATEEAEESNPSFEVTTTATTSTTVSNCNAYNTSRILLATAVVLIEDDIGCQVPARALLDSGSESNFITETLSQRINLSRERVQISVSGIGQASLKVKQRVHAVIKSKNSNFNKPMSFLVLPRVTANLPTTTINTREWKIPDGFKLADPSFFESKSVDIVLGIEAFFEYFETGRRISLGDGMPALTESVFGWIVSGGLADPSQSLKLNCHVSMEAKLEEILTRFWAAEEVGTSRKYSPEEQRCEDMFRESIKRNGEGRYIVSLPKITNIWGQLGSSKDIALRRLHSTERRLARNEELRKQYLLFMAEYEMLGHMQEIIPQEVSSVKRCYLPHHPVIKEDSTTTRLRVVFDASCKTSSGCSLNDLLLTGPVIQDDLREIILRCRTKQILVVADVEKMFRQVLVNPKDRPLQTILWRASPLNEVKTYELNTITYGTKAAPFLATRVLKQLALDERHRFPLAAKAYLEDTYMDDVITGADDAETALELRIQLEKAATCGGFRLRKFASNAKQILESVSKENLAILDSSIHLDADPSVKTLGLSWLPNSDVLMFRFNVPVLPEHETLTKRRILSVIATLFDPLGLLGAAITKAKILMQQLWTLKDECGNRLGWDQPVPSTVGEIWRNYYYQLPVFNQIQVNRCVILPNAITVEFHCFSDASERAFGGCIYVRSFDAQGAVKIQLLSSKSKVAPLKCQSIPRLELCGALLVAELEEKVRKAVKIQTIGTIFWTDSTCVLRWIQAPPLTWTTFVANRVSKIQTLTNGCEWRHVSGLDNPADLISRGISPTNIVDNHFWWNGPAWLKENREQWPTSSDDIPADVGNDELRRTTVAATGSSYADFNEWFFGKFSSYFEMIRKTAYLLRFMKLIQKKLEGEPNAFLSSAEIKEAERVLIHRVQQETFAAEITALRKNEDVSSKSPLKWFRPFLDEDGLVRLGGRLKNSSEIAGFKNPVILPARHIITRLIFEHYHLRLMHAGPQLLLASVRQKFWPLGGRSVAKQIVHKCIKCFRSRPTPIQQLMGDLPAVRVTESRPFANTGVDYFGPMYTRPAPRRPAVKAYVAIFICMCTKAVHMELVTDLSTDCFIKALQRFISRRGFCSQIFSDNGTNFVGARNKFVELQRLLKNKTHHEKVSKECSRLMIQWHFSPPASPHFGGLWEAAVRSAKKHLLIVIGETPLPPEDLSTLVIQAEACLNSRPIMPLKDDPTDLEPLTPAHFIIGTSLQDLPEEDMEACPDNRLSHFQLICKKKQLFWKRWHHEYLSLLQGRNKRWKSPVKVEVGRLVVVCDERTAPCNWRMGRIEEVYPGSDGTVRVVKLKTASGSITREAEKVCVLPIYSDSESQ